MIKISEALNEIIGKNSLLRFGMYYKLLNLSQTARFIKPLLETRLKRPVQATAIIMNLSRLQRKMKGKIEEEKFEIENVTIQMNLCVMTFFKSEEIREKIERVYHKIQGQKGFMTITQGPTEITVIFEHSFIDLVEKAIPEKPKDRNDKISSISVKFDEKFLQISGLLYVILQQVALQNINIIELTSTGTEMIIYVAEKDAKLTFNTIYNRFFE